MKSLEREVRETIEQYGMLKRGDSLVAGLSGGADSVCLLSLLAGLREELELSLRALHVHHGLRENADLDEAFCRELCRDLQVPLTCVHVDAAAYGAAHHLGVEEAGRILRYRAFGEEADRTGGRIAVAHHMEDQAETVLFQICRGSSLSGLAGMKPVNGRIIRPLLFVTRERIEQWLREKGLSFRTDETNEDPAYSRNFIRGKVLPLLREGVNAGTDRHLSDLAREAGEAERYLEMLTDRALEACLAPEEGRVKISLKALQALDPYMRGRILYRALALAAGRKKDLGQVHVRSLLELCGKGGSASLSLPGGVMARKTYDLLTLEKAGEEECPPGYPLDPSEYSFRIFPFDGDLSGLPQMLYTKWFDYDKINTVPEFRTRQQGDRLTISESGASKTAARYMIDLKIPAVLRDRIILPMHGSELLWLPGGRISAGYKVSHTTAHVLEITWKGRQK